MKTEITVIDGAVVVKQDDVVVLHTAAPSPPGVPQPAPYVFGSSAANNAGTGGGGGVGGVDPQTGAPVMFSNTINFEGNAVIDLPWPSAADGQYAQQKTRVLMGGRKGMLSLRIQTGPATGTKVGFLKTSAPAGGSGNEPIAAWGLLGSPGVTNQGAQPFPSIWFSVGNGSVLYGEGADLPANGVVYFNLDMQTTDDFDIDFMVPR